MSVKVKILRINGSEPTSPGPSLYKDDVIKDLEKLLEERFEIQSCVVDDGYLYYTLIKYENNW